jgi:hypothetical protein
MQGAEILIEFFGREVSTGEPLLRAAVDGSGKSLRGEAPAARFRLREEPVEFGGRRGHYPGCAAVGSGLAGLRAV